MAGAPDDGPLRDLAYLGSNVVMLAFDMSDRYTMGISSACCSADMDLESDCTVV